MTPGAASTRIIEAYDKLDGDGRWIRIADIAETTRLSHQDIVAGIRHLLEECDGFRTSEQPLSWRVTPDDRAAEVFIGGSPQHLIRFY